jgi:molybdenum cofactor synthesis domain-containing protein
MGEKTPLKAAVIIVGNEILSGRTQDSNIKYIADRLATRGISIVEIRVVPDIEARIIEAVNALKGQVDYVFTTGGIGPTHDDITAESIAKAFGVKLVQSAEALAVLEKNYGTKDLNPARLKMTMVPEGASLIPNPVSGAPGFIIGNVHVMAGVPAIMQGMLESILPHLREGAKIQSRTVNCELPESKVAADLDALQKKFPDVDIGSYPHFKPGHSMVSLVLRSTDIAALEKATDGLVKIVKALGAVPDVI